MMPVKSPHVRTTLVTSGRRIESGRRLAQRTAAWMEANEGSFRAIYGFVESMRDGERVGRVRDRVAAFCVDQGIDVGGGSRAFDNDLWAGISRYIVLLDPSLDGAPIRMRESDIDCYGILPVSYLPNLGKDA